MHSENSGQTCGFELIDEGSVDTIQRWLVELGVIAVDEAVQAVTTAGEGNMNVVLRVQFAEKTVIVKQSRPWVAKYPSIAAPQERIDAELDFYRRTLSTADVADRMPGLLGSHSERRLIVLEDLGASQDYLSLYASDDVVPSDTDAVFRSAVQWLSRLHRIPLDPSEWNSVGCHSLRCLNHEHIFSIPLQIPAAVDLNSLCGGLEERSDHLRGDGELRLAMDTLGETYLSTGGHLLHGDYYPGSWLHTSEGFRVIDPEFCFAGPVEFDLGVMSAHRVFCGAACDRSTIDQLCQWYNGETVDVSLVARFAGAELIRRILGVAQLPLQADLSRRIHWIESGREWILAGTN